MTNSEYDLYITLLEMLKARTKTSISAVARKSGLSRQGIYNILERRTFQDLNKYNGYFTLFFHSFHKLPSTFLDLKQAYEIVA